MSNDKSQSPQTVSVIFNAESIEKLKECYSDDKKSNYLAACGNDFQKVADTIVSFGVSRWAALSKHAESKGRGPLIPGERKTRNSGSGTPSTPRKPKDASAVVTRNGVEAEIAKLTNGASKQTSIPGSEAKPDKPAESKGKEQPNGRVVHDKPSKEWLRQQAAEKKADDIAKAALPAKNGAAKPPKAETKAPVAPTAPKPAKGAAKAPKEWVITYNPRRQTCCVPQDDAKTEADAREYAVREFKVDPKKILHVALQAEA